MDFCELSETKSTEKILFFPSVLGKLEKVPGKRVSYSLGNK